MMKEKLTPKEKNRIGRLLLDGMDPREVADKTGHRLLTVRDLDRELVYDMAPRDYYGEDLT